MNLKCVKSVLIRPHVANLSIQGTGKWYEMQDLQVTDILPQMITLSEAYIQASPPTHRGVFSCSTYDTP